MMANGSGLTAVTSRGALGAEGGRGAWWGGGGGRKTRVTKGEREGVGKENGAGLLLCVLLH